MKTLSTLTGTQSVPMRHRPEHRSWHIAASVMALLSAAMLMLAGSVTGMVPTVGTAYAAGASVQATAEGGSLNPDGDTTVDLSGSGFQSVQNGFGGIYVLFGWVSDPNGDSWKPSQGGITGESYKYVPDDENNPAGYDVFVSFPGSSTESASNGGEIASDGTWSAKITVPGARFTSYDRNGNPSDVDCTTVQCGIITIGAHGVSNANNETFTPMTFTATTATDTGDAVQATEQNEQQQAQPNGASATKRTQQTTQSATDQSKSAAQDAAETAAEGMDMGTASPAWGIAGWLIIAAAIIFGIALIVLAAGVGGYLAAKSLLLGVSPAALEKEMARRERRAEDRRYREQLKSMKRQRRQYQRLAKAQAQADRVHGAVSAGEVDEGDVRPFATIAVADTQAVPAAPAEDVAVAEPVQSEAREASEAATQVLAMQVPQASGASSAPVRGPGAGTAGHSADIRGFFARRAQESQHGDANDKRKGEAA